MTAIPVDKAYWCENCNSVIDTPASCPGCGTTHSIVALANWIKETQIEIPAIVGTGDNSRG